MRKIFVVLFTLFVLITINGCYKDKEEELYKISCDTATVSYSIHIEPLVNKFCNACHGSNINTSLGAGIDLQGYDNLKGNVDNGKFLSSVIHDGNASFMPKNSEKLSDCHISLISKWIEDGARDN